MSAMQKWNEKVDKENTKMGPVSIKKEKGATEEQPKKKVLGEASNQVFVVEEPNSPDDDRLLARKREMKKNSCAGFTLQMMNACWFDSCQPIEIS